MLSLPLSGTFMPLCEDDEKRRIARYRRSANRAGGRPRLRDRSFSGYRPQVERAGSFAEPVRFYGACTGICTAGSCTISLNLKISEIRPGDLIFIVPGTIVHIPRQSDDFSLCMTGFSAEFLKGIYQAINPLYPYIFQTPVLPLAADDAETLLDLFDLLYEKALRKEHCYCREIVQNLLLTLFYEISALYQKNMRKATGN